MQQSKRINVDTRELCYMVEKYRSLIVRVCAHTKHESWVRGVQFQCYVDVQM